MVEKTVPQTIRQLLESTYTDRVRSRVGDYAGVYDCGDGNYELISSTDGVGTKICIACPLCAEDHECIGEDVVNHCVNDILVTGAEPLFFLNYFGYSHPEAEKFMTWVIGGMSRAARAVAMPIISGETANMQGFYPYPEAPYDVVGTIIGRVEVGKRLDGADVDPGDVLVGIRSSGVHTNGFTAIRDIFCRSDRPEHVKKAWRETVKNLGMSVREACLQPHRCYYNLVKPMLSRFPIRAIAHVTGGGIEANISRVIGANKARIDWVNWKWPDLFNIISSCSTLAGCPLSDEEMKAQFNLGIGLILVVRKAGLSDVMSHLASLKEMPVVVGAVV